MKTLKQILEYNSLLTHTFTQKEREIPSPERTKIMKLMTPGEEEPTKDNKNIKEKIKKITFKEFIKENMIATASQSGQWVYVYGPNGQVLYIVDGQLVGFTPQFVSVKDGMFVYIYDSRGIRTGVVPA